MATKVNNLTLANALKFLKDGYVLSKKSGRWNREKEEYTIDRNIIQILFKDDEYHLFCFDGYGNKTRSNCKIIEQDSIENYLTTSSEREIWAYHKQRIPKKENNSSIVDEETAKILVYDWLLKKYKNEDDVIVPEITLGSRRADYMAFGKKEICIVEIKSEVDTIQRLQEQINQYIHYGNLVYIAIHKTKIKSIEKLDIPDFVGIIEIDKKLKIIKKAKKQKINFTVFKSFVSYQEFLSMRSGFKGSSTIEKIDMEIIFDKFFSEKQKSNFLFELIKNRYKVESRKRLEAHKDGYYEKAVGSAKNVGIDRLSPNLISYLSLKNFFELDENFIKSYLMELNVKIEKLYKKCNYLDLILNDWILLLMILKRLQIPYRSDNSKILKLFILIDNVKELLGNQLAIEEIISKNILKSVNKASNIQRDKLLIIETNSKESQNIITAKLLEQKIGHATLVMRSDFYGVIKSSAFENKRVLVLNNQKRKYYHRDKEVDKIELWNKSEF